MTCLNILNILWTKTKKRLFLEVKLSLFKCKVSCVRMSTSHICCQVTTTWGPLMMYITGGLTLKHMWRSSYSEGTLDYKFQSFWGQSGVPVWARSHFADLNNSQQIFGTLAPGPLKTLRKPCGGSKKDVSSLVKQALSSPAMRSSIRDFHCALSWIPACGGSKWLSQVLTSMKRSTSVEFWLYSFHFLLPGTII